MQASNAPTKSAVPFAESGAKNTIPVASQIGVTPGAASFTDGFPPLTMMPLAAGGIPPRGQDFNGILYFLSNAVRWNQSGGIYKFDAAFSDAVGGYPKGATLLSSDGAILWLSLSDNNSTNPDAGPSPNWTGIRLAVGSIGFTDSPTAPTPGRGDNSQKLATTEFVSRTIGSYPMMVSIVDVPTTNMGPIMIAEAGEMWLWTSTAYYTGYRSPLCGRPLLGHTPNPFVNEVDAVGGLLSKTAYPALWGYAQEAGLVVSQTVWTANIGAHYFVDVNSTQFRVPDLRDMHFRHTGTNADGGARALGTKQLDASQRLQGVLGATQEIGVNGVFAALPGTTTPFYAAPKPAHSFTQVQMDTSRTSRVSTETRGVNVAFHPRIHI